MVFHWSLSDSKSPQVSRVLLRMMVDLNNAIVWMVSTLPVISKSFSLCNNPLGTVLWVPITIGMIVSFIFHIFFNSLGRSRYLSSFFSLSFNFNLWLVGTVKSTIRQVLFFCVDYYRVWSSGRDLVIRFFVKILEEFLCLIFKDIFCVVLIPFVRMVK